MFWIDDNYVDLKEIDVWMLSDKFSENEYASLHGKIETYSIEELERRRKEGGML